MSLNFTFVKDYFIIGLVLALARFVGLLEEMEHWWESIPERRKRAYVRVLGCLLLGRTRKDMIRVVREIGYGEEYAKKFVDRLIKRLRRFSLVEAEIWCRKGIFGRPWSRSAGVGRSPAVYRLKKPPCSPLSSDREEVVKRVAIVVIVNGLFLRFLEQIMNFLGDKVFRDELAKLLAELILETDSRAEYEGLEDVIRDFLCRAYENRSLLIRYLERVCCGVVGEVYEGR